MQQTVKRVQKKLNKNVMTLTSMDLHLNVIIPHFTFKKMASEFHHITIVNHIAEIWNHVLTYKEHVVKIFLPEQHFLTFYYILSEGKKEKKSWSWS